MSKYTTGEMAKLCDITVRTVQYYDTRGILVPSELSEGGRRLYSEEDLRKLKIICFLRELDLPINSIDNIGVHNGGHFTSCSLFRAITVSPYRKKDRGEDTGFALTPCHCGVKCGRMRP